MTHLTVIANTAPEPAAERSRRLSREARIAALEAASEVAVDAESLAVRAQQLELCDSLPVGIREMAARLRVALQATGSMQVLIQREGK
jgi:hypothetical protein